MAIYNQGVDITMKISDYLKTTTSQYRAVGMPDTSTCADHTVYACNGGAAINNTLTARCAIGIIQDMLSAGSSEATIRVMGVSKAIGMYSITAGDFVYAAVPATTTFGKLAIMGDFGQTNLASVVMSASSVCLGRALEDGSSNGCVITILLTPHLVLNN